MSRYGGFKGRFDAKRFIDKFINQDGTAWEKETIAYNQLSGVHDLSDTSTYVDNSLYAWPVGERILMNPNIAAGPVSDNWSNTLQRYSIISGNPASVVLNLEQYISTSSIAKLTIPIDGSYTIEVAGAGSTPIIAGFTPGFGAIIRATFELTQGTILWIIVGQQNEQHLAGYTRTWQGGSGGSFVSYGNSLDSSDPLIIAGGGGGIRSGSSNIGAYGQMNTKGGDGASTAGTPAGDRGQRGSGGGHNRISIPDGGSASFYDTAFAHTDNRNNPVGWTHTGAVSARQGANGGTFRNLYDTSYRGSGGFGCGGPGGFGGQGAGGGYSGGGNGDNGSGEIGGGGGSFIADYGNVSAVGTSTGVWEIDSASAVHPTPVWIGDQDPTFTFQIVGGLDVLGYNEQPGYVSITRV